MPIESETSPQIHSEPLAKPAAGNTTMALGVYSQLREDILMARLAPGSKLRTRELCERYQVGLSPLREALSRLSSEGMVVQSAQRGFTVSSFSIEDLDELVRTKKWVNEIGLRESIRHGDAGWEEAVMLAWHRLLRTPRYTSDQAHEAYRDVRWNQAHLAFHTALLSACRSHWLLEFCERLFYASDRYRALSRLIPNAGARDQEHESIMRAAIDRKADLAVELLNEHFDATAAVVRVKISEQLLGG